ncbi:Trypsin [Popillia japonica]|uniref:Trypsin n=1 Tax=Popillia japonica TaxID=7064 RepID=A0AAW1NKL3_POPJA
MFIYVVRFVFPKFGFNPRIVGGQNATEGQFPYQISLRYYGSHNCGGSILNKHYYGSHNCGGSILNKHSALTAAHCVDGYFVSALSVISGSIYLSVGGNFNKVIKVIIHENWDPYNIKNDLAVIKIDGEFDLDSNFISPIDLEHSFIGEKECVAFYWGEGMPVGADCTAGERSQINSNLFG